MTAPEIPGYRYLEHLGSGGFADVYAYQQEWPQQVVAVKVVRPDLALGERERALFTSEANAMARLADHPNIVPVLTAGMTADDRPFLVMRYCPPPDLGARVRSRPLGVADAISTGIKLASAVETAHRIGMVHRDIKPSNVLVTSYLQPALSDFGIAGRFHEIAAEDEVRISYPWSPPEMLDGRSNGSVASDVYSLGATIWHLLVGRSPFSMPGGDNSTRALGARIMHQPAPPTRRPDVPPALDRLLQQSMAKQASHRPHSAMELGLALQRIEAAARFPRTPMAVEGSELATARATATDEAAADDDHTRLKPVVLPASGPPARPGHGAAEPAAPDPGRARPTVVVSAVVAVLVLVGVAVGLMLRGGEEPGPEETTPTATPSTPDPVTAELSTPLVEGRPVDAGAERPGVRFTWSAADPQPGDSWEWQDPDTGRSDRTGRRAVVVRGAGEHCLQVRLIRGAVASNWGTECVSTGAGR